MGKTQTARGKSIQNRREQLSNARKSKGGSKPCNRKDHESAKTKSTAVSAFEFKIHKIEDRSMNDRLPT